MPNNIYIESPIREKKYRNLARLGKVLGIPIPECFLEMQVTLPDSKIVHHHKQRSHSWTRNAYNVIACTMLCLDANDATFQAGSLSIKDTAGSIKSGAAPACNGQGTMGFSNTNLASSDSICYMAANNIATYGIQVGSGSTAESFEDYTLETLIADGTGAGQLSYVGMNPHALSYDVGTKTFTCTLIRYINNNSLGIITVNEVGLTSRMVNLTANSLGNYLLCRDVLGSSVEIPVSGQLKVTYIISLTFPA